MKSDHSAGKAPRPKDGKRLHNRGCVMLKTTYAIAVAAIAAACFVGWPSLSAQVEASAPVPGAKGDRADIRPIGVDCTQHAWPYFEASCLRDARTPLGQPRDVRMVSADRTN
jgi:hypothetical protein